MTTNGERSPDVHETARQRPNQLSPVGTVAYFSMEIALGPALPTYSGGLGVLAGDVLRSAADLGLPLVGVTLLYRKGYFVQHLDQSGWQTESDVAWPPADPTATIYGGAEVDVVAVRTLADLAGHSARPGGTSVPR